MLFLSRLFLFVGLLACLFLSASCVRKALVLNEFSEDDCPISDSSHYYDSLTVASLQRYKIDTTDCHAQLYKRFSRRAINIADNLGIKNLLCEFTRLEGNPAKEKELGDLKNELHFRITIGTNDAASCLSEIECQAVRVKELQIHLNDWINTRINRATAYSILAGGVTTIIAGLVATNVIKIKEENDLANRVEQGTVIIGAIAGTYYSFRAMAINKTVQYIHKRNHIGAVILKQNTQNIYPDFVWKFMTKPFQKDNKTTNGVEDILHKWQSLDLPAPLSQKGHEEVKTLFAGIGGEYSADDLDNRIEMYDILREEISLINYDLKRLQQEIVIGYKGK